MTGDDAKGILKIHERREAMESALDIVSTQTKLQAKEAVRVAKLAHNEVTEKFQLATSKANAALEEAGLELLTSHPLTQKIIDVVKALSGVEITAENAWHWGETHYSRVHRTGDDFYVVSSSRLDFEISMTDDDDSTVTTARNKEVKMDMDIKAYEGLPELVADRDRLSEEDDAARAEVKRAEERLANHDDQLEVARIHLQRGKLADMGDTGTTALEMVDKVIAASDGKAYLELL